MKRKVLLLLGTFLTLILVFAVYHFTAGSVGIAKEEMRKKSRLTASTGPADQPSTAPAAAGAPMEATRGEMLVLEKRNAESRLEGVYILPKWDKIGEGLYRVQEPNVILFQKSGERTYIHADWGEMAVEDLVRGTDVRSGKLSGNVEIFIDTSRDAAAERTGPAERPQDFVRIYTDDLHFDNDRLTMFTDSNLSLLSKQADIFGQGLSIHWRENPQELMTLRIDHGREMVVYNVPEGMDVISLPGGATATGGNPKANSGGPTTRKAAPIASLATSEPLQAQSPAVLELIPPTPVRAASQSATDKGGPRQNIYQVDFFQNVRVDSGARHLKGADTLTLVFDMTQGLPGSENEGKKDKASPSQKTSPAAPSPRAGGTASSKPAGVAQQPMVITWAGPLVLQPVGYTPTPSNKRFDVSAKGPRVVLWDDKSMALCGRFLYRSPNSEGMLEGAPGLPTRLLMADGQEIAAERMRFFRAEGVAQLEGPGHMIRGPRPPNMEAAEAMALARQEAHEPVEAGQDRIVWKDQVLVNFTHDAQSGRDSIKDADFTGDVELTQASTGDWFRSQNLLTLMGQGKHGQTVLTKAIASGHVQGRQQGAQIKNADQVLVLFEELPEANETAAPPRADAMPLIDTQSRMQPVTLEATGSVVIEANTSGEPVLATADKLTCDLPRRTARLTGSATSPARVQQDTAGEDGNAATNILEGEQIFLRDEKDGNSRPQQHVNVVGPGSMRFVTKSDMNGATLQRPRLVNLHWTQSMDYDGSAGEVTFTGDPNVQSGPDQMTCRKTMKLLFESAPPTAPAAAAAPKPVKAPVADSSPATAHQQQPGIAALLAPPGAPGALARALPSAASAPATSKAAVAAAPRRQLGLGLDSYSGRQIATLTADEDVTLSSLTLDDQGCVLRRIKVQSNQLIYDHRTGETSTHGPGMLWMEDYRPPDPNVKADQSGDNISHPIQAVFLWETAMTLSQNNRTAVLDGNVNMVCYSGMYIDREGLNAPPWGVVKVGRMTSMRCNRFLAKFLPAPSSTTPSTGPAASSMMEGGPRVGSLEHFLALGQVHAIDGDRQKRDLVCESLEYDQPMDMVTLLGSLPAQPPMEAVMSFKNLDTRQRDPIRSTKILWYRKNDYIETANTTAGR